MRKLTGVLLVFVISVLLVAACSPASPSETEVPGRTPVVAGGTEGVVETPSLESTTAGVTEAPTMATTGAVTEAVTPQTGPSVTESPAVTPPAAGSPTAAIPETGLATHPWLASSWLGQQVFDLNCEPVGQVSGLVIGQGNGQIMYAWVTLNADLLAAPATTQAPVGTATPEATEAPAVANMVLIPWAATTLGQTEGASQNCTEPGLVLAVDRAAVQGAPAFEAAPDTTAAGWDTDVQTYWSGQMTGAPLAGTPMAGTPAVTETPSATEAPSQGAGASAGEPLLIDNISAWRVVDEGGSNLGPVQDMLLDPAAGQITYLIWKPGGFLQVSPRLVPLPLTAGTFDASSGHFVLNQSLTANQVEQAPGFQSLDEAGNPADNPDWIQNAQDFWSQFQD